MTSSADPSSPPFAMQVWVLGASMGGPQAIKRFLLQMPGGMPVCFVLAQHIFEKDLPILATQLDRLSAYRVLPLHNGSQLQAGTLVLAPVDKQIRFNQHGLVTLHSSPTNSYYHPSIDSVITGVADYYGNHSGAIIFSGMGNDGIKGCQHLRTRQGTVWAQSKQSCVISSMPEHARESGAVSFSGNPEQLANQLCCHLQHWQHTRQLPAIDAPAAPLTIASDSGL